MQDNLRVAQRKLCGSDEASKTTQSSNHDTAALAGGRSTDCQAPYDRCFTCFVSNTHSACHHTATNRPFPTQLIARQRCRGACGA